MNDINCLTLTDEEFETYWEEGLKEVWAYWGNEDFESFDLETVESLLEDWEEED